MYLFSILHTFSNGFGRKKIRDYPVYGVCLSVTVVENKNSEKWNRWKMEKMKPLSLENKTKMLFNIFKKLKKIQT